MKNILEFIVKYLNDYQVDPGDKGEEQNHIEVILNKIGIEFVSEERGWQIKESRETFEQCLREEFLINTQNYPEEYHKLFSEKFKRAEKRYNQNPDIQTDYRDILTKYKEYKRNRGLIVYSDILIDDFLKTL
jgi:hypothetical protein